MLYLDIPTRDELAALIETRDGQAVSLFLETTPVSGEVAGDPVRLKNAAREADERLAVRGAAGDDRRAIAEQLDALIEDEEFWRFQAHSLALFATPQRLWSFRLPNRLPALVEVADRFHVKPLFRAVTFPHAAFVLALSEDRARLFELGPEGPLQAVEIDGLPDGAGDRANAAERRGRRPAVRMRSGEGERMAFEKYAHGVDRALRPFLAGQELPLVVAADVRLGAIFRPRCSYPRLAPRYIAHTPDDMSEHDLAAAARAMLDEIHAAQVEAWHERYEERTGARRSTTDLAQAARAATQGAVEWLAVDIEQTVHGQLDDEGGLTLSDQPGPACHGVVDEIARRAFLSGATVSALRPGEMPGGGALAATLRWPA